MKDEIRGELGSEGHLLDKYLSVIFETLGRLDLTTIATIIDDFCWGITGDCYRLCEGEHEKARSKFYNFVKSYIEKHPLDFEYPHTKTEVYLAKILLDNLENFAVECGSNIKKRLLSDINYLEFDEAYDKMTEKISEERIKHLNDTIEEAFVFAPVIMIVCQQIVMRIMEIAGYQNFPDSKEIFNVIFKFENKLMKGYFSGRNKIF